MAKKGVQCNEIKDPPTKLFKVGILIGDRENLDIIVVTAHRMCVVDGVLYFEVDRKGETDDIAIFNDWVYCVETNEVIAEKEDRRCSWGTID